MEDTMFFLHDTNHNFSFRLAIDSLATWTRHNAFFAPSKLEHTSPAPNVTAK